MNNKKFNIGQFILSYILPRKMVVHKDMSFLVSLLLLIIAAFLNISTSNMRAKKDATNNVEQSLPTLFTKADASFKIDGLPVVSLDKKDGIYLEADANGVFVDTYTVDGKTMEVTVVINKDVIYNTTEPSKTTILNNFDLEGYTKRKLEENHEYLLYILTKDSFVILCNLEQDQDGTIAKNPYLTFMYENDGKDYTYYLPKDSSEVVLNEWGNLDTTKWTRQCAKDDMIETEKFDLDSLTDEQKELLKNVKPATRHKKAIYEALCQPNISYTDLDGMGLNVTELTTSFATFQDKLKSSLIQSHTNKIKIDSLKFSFLVTMIFPLFFSLITWLMSKSFNLKKYRNYFAICSICFLLASLIGVISGIFISYTDFAFCILLAASIYFIIATFRINTMETSSDDDKKGPEQPVRKPIVYTSDSARIG